MLPAPGSGRSAGAVAHTSPYTDAGTPMPQLNAAEQPTIRRDAVLAEVFSQRYDEDRPDRHEPDRFGPSVLQRPVPGPVDQVGAAHAGQWPAATDDR